MSLEAFCILETSAPQSGPSLGLALDLHTLFGTWLNTATEQKGFPAITLVSCQIVTSVKR